LLAAWGHSVVVLTKPGDPLRGLGESLPPSTQKLLHAVGVLDDVERAGFYRTSGNTVWWASRDRRVEMFDPGGRLLGYQVHRPALDAVLLAGAHAAGAAVYDGATVRQVRVDDRGAEVEYECDRTRARVRGRFVLDCSGRAGVLAKQYRRPEPGHRMYSLVGVWSDARLTPSRDERTKPSRSERSEHDPPDPTHTLVETYEDGWAWSVPISTSMRHIGTMVDGTSPRVTGERRLGDAYRAEIAKTTEMRRVATHLTLDRVWACDASLYSSDRYAGPGFLLVGDAASFIDPLSSFGVKKALASAWVGAVVVHTCLAHPERQETALEFFSRWEQDAYAAHLRRSRAFAQAARGQHPHAFWALRAEGDADEAESGDAALARDPGVQAAFEMFRASPEFELGLGAAATFEPRPVIRGREIVLENTFAGLRFFRNVDLVTLADLACRHRRVPDVFEAYCSACAPVPLPSVLGGLCLLVARGILLPLPNRARR